METKNEIEKKGEKDIDYSEKFKDMVISKFTQNVGKVSLNNFQKKYNYQ